MKLTYRPLPSLYSFDNVRNESFGPGERQQACSKEGQAKWRHQAQEGYREEVRAKGGREQWYAPLQREVSL